MVSPLNQDVTKFLNALNHPLRNEIEELRKIILEAENALVENIKWNGPNYSINNEDRITLKIQPPKQLQLIFHRGAKVKEQPKKRLIKDNSGILLWKENDRAVATFINFDAILTKKQDLLIIVKHWILAT
tara:strand:+ start:184 stop:573 length:390 start_codon:yes stop_codon:yes gene_type:complete